MTKPTNSEKPSTAKKPTIKEAALSMVEKPIVEFDEGSGEFTTENLHVRFLVNLVTGGNKARIRKILENPEKAVANLMSDPFGHVALALYARCIFGAIALPTHKDPTDWMKSLTDMQKAQNARPKGGMARDEHKHLHIHGSEQQLAQAERIIGEVLDVAKEGEDSSK